MRVQSKLFLTVVCLFFSVGLAMADNWPTWRGPNQDGITGERDLPLHWNEQENIVWRAALPGASPSTPVIWGDRVFLTSTVRESDEVLLICIDTKGRQRWKQVVGRGKSEQAVMNNLAAPSPSTDGTYVWTLTGDGALACHDLDGNLQWQFHVEDRYEKVKMPWGMASSPMPHGDLLYVQLFHLNASRIVALEKATGREVWNVVRPTDARGKCLRSYATPVIFSDAGRQVLLIHGQDYISAHDLADGHEIWRCGGFHPASGYDPMMHVASSPVAAAPLVLVPSAPQGNFQVIRGGGEGNVTDDADHHLWSARVSPRIPSALAVDRLVYICRDRGVLLCLDAITGKQYYKRPVHRKTYFASPVYGDGKIYLTAFDGTVTVVAPGKQFKILAKNTIDEPTAASPAIAGGRIYLRTFQALYAIGK